MKIKQSNRFGNLALDRLVDQGARLHNALQLARQNYKFFKAHKASVDLLERLQAK